MFVNTIPHIKGASKNLEVLFELDSLLFDVGHDLSKTAPEIIEKLQALEKITKGELRPYAAAAAFLLKLAFETQRASVDNLSEVEIEIKAPWTARRMKKRCTADSVREMLKTCHVFVPVSPKNVSKSAGRDIIGIASNDIDMLKSACAAGETSIARHIAELKCPIGTKDSIDISTWVFRTDIYGTALEEAAAAGSTTVARYMRYVEDIQPTGNWAVYWATGRAVDMQLISKSARDMAARIGAAKANNELQKHLDEVIAVHRNGVARWLVDECGMDEEALYTSEMEVLAARSGNLRALFTIYERRSQKGPQEQEHLMNPITAFNELIRRGLIGVLHAEKDTELSKELMKHMRGINIIDKPYSTPETRAVISTFYSACENGKEAQVQDLCKRFKGAANHGDNKNRNGLYFAAKNNRLGVVKILLSFGASMSKRKVGPHKITPFKIAAYEGHADIVKFMMSSPKFSMAACCPGYIDFIRNLSMRGNLKLVLEIQSLPPALAGKPNEQVQPQTKPQTQPQTKPQPQTKSQAHPPDKQPRGRPVRMASMVFPPRTEPMNNTCSLMTQNSSKSQDR